MLVCQFGNALRLTYSLCGRQRFVLRWYEVARVERGGEFPAVHGTWDDAMVAAQKFNVRHCGVRIAFPVRYEPECLN